jgi:DNA polymerase-3 subunit delta
MAPRRLVELRQVQDAPVAVLDALLEYVQKPVDGTVLMVVGDRMPAASGGVDRGLRIVNAVKKGGCFYKAEGKSADPLAIARGRAGLWRATVDAKAVQKLRELGGDDIDVLAANVDLCAGYVGEGGAITALVVDTVCASTAEASVWRLTDAIVAREPNGALAELHRLLDDGEPPHKLLSTIGWQMRQVLLVQDASRRQLPPGEAGVRMQPDKLRMVRQVCEQRPVSPSGWLEELAAVNRRMNSSRAGDRRAIEDFVLRLATS